MNGRSHLHSARALPALVVAVLLVIGATGTAVAAPTHHVSKPKTLHLAGKWSGRYSGAVSGTFTLRWTQSGNTLHGSIKLSNPAGRYRISGSVHGARISFGAVGVGATYTGTVKPGLMIMSGHWKSGPGGGTWTAHRVS